MTKRPKLTRAQLRDHQGEVDATGVYGVDADDAGADTWIGRYVFFARSRDEARARIRDAGFHKRRIQREWRPGHAPPDGLPADLAPGNDHWYRTRFDDSGWTPWERLPRDYRHPPQGLAAADPSVR
ncbi:hypothetical protein GCM10028777_02240 [Angustibacter speluncae]